MTFDDVNHLQIGALKFYERREASDGIKPRGKYFNQFKC